MSETLRLSFEQIVTGFDSILKWHSNRMRPKGMDPEDLYQSLIIDIHEREWPRSETWCLHLKRKVPYDPARINRFIKSRVIDYLRYSTRKHRQTVNNETLLDRADDRNVEPSAAFEIIRRLESRLDPRDFQIVKSIIDPECTIVNWADQDQKDALRDRQSGHLRMNVRGDARIKKSHVATFHGVSPATVSRAWSKARECLETMPLDPSALPV